MLFIKSMLVLFSFIAITLTCLGDAKLSLPVIIFNSTSNTIKYSPTDQKDSPNSVEVKPNSYYSTNYSAFKDIVVDQYNTITHEVQVNYWDANRMKIGFEDENHDYDHCRVAIFNVKNKDKLAFSFTGDGTPILPVTDTHISYDSKDNIFNAALLINIFKDDVSGEVNSTFYALKGIKIINESGEDNISFHIYNSSSDLYNFKLDNDQSKVFYIADEFNSKTVKIDCKDMYNVPSSITLNVKKVASIHGLESYKIYMVEDMDNIQSGVYKLTLKNNSDDYVDVLTFSDNDDI